MSHARDAETIGLLFNALIQHNCPTVSLLAQRLVVPYGPPLLVAIGVIDDPRSRWAEIDEVVGRLQRAERPAEPPHDRVLTWEKLTERERAN